MVVPRLVLLRPELTLHQVFVVGVKLVVPLVFVFLYQLSETDELVVVVSGHTRTLIASSNQC